MRKIWPADAGISLEEVGLTAITLQCRAHVIGDDVHVRPHNPNVLFALGLESGQKVARLGPFLGASLHCSQNSRTFLHGKILTYNHLTQGSSQHMYVHIGLLLLEVERLGWPQRWISGSLCSLSRRHISPFISACRRVGKQFRHCSLGFLFPPCELVDLVASSKVEAAVYPDMSKQWCPQNRRPFGRNQEVCEGSMPREVLDFMREEQRRRAEACHTTEIQKHAKDAALQVRGFTSSAFDSFGPTTQKSQPFEMLRWGDSEDTRRNARSGRSDPHPAAAPGAVLHFYVPFRKTRRRSKRAKMGSRRKPRAPGKRREVRGSSGPSRPVQSR